MAKTAGNPYTIAQTKPSKEQDQEQKRFLRRSHGEDSRKPIANRTDQPPKSKSVYASGE